MQVDAHELNNQLAARAAEVCQYLFPNGTREGNEWCVGSVNGEKGTSLKVVLSGRKAGAWKDFAGGPDDRGRKLLGLWAAARRITWREALVEAAKYLGVDVAPATATAPVNLRTYNPIDRKVVAGKICGLKPQSRVFRRLIEERGIAPEVVKAYCVTALRDDTGYCFASFEGDPRTSPVVACKYKALDLLPNGKKRIWQEEGGKPILWGMWTVPPDSDHVVITEGEEDAMSFASDMIPAVSMPGGAQNLQWIDLCWDWLQGFQRIYIAFDSDAEGQAAMRTTIDRLGRERCFIVTFPDGVKDANEWRVNEGDAHMRSLQPRVDIAQPLDPDELCIAEQFREETWKSISSPTRGIGFDFSATWQYRPGELTLLTGEPGAGKSQWTLQISIELLSRDIPCFIASMEIPTKKYLGKMARMVNGGGFWDCKTKGFDRSAFDRSFHRLAPIHVYDRGRMVGAVKWQDVIKSLTYARKRFGVQWFVIDSLMMCGIRQDDYETQERFAEALATTCTNTGLSGILVAHPRKEGGERDGPDRLFTLSDIKGASSLVAVPHNVVVIQRRHREEDKVNEAINLNDPVKLGEALENPTTMLRVLKDRDEGRLGFSKLFFDIESEQFTDEFLKYRTYLGGRARVEWRDRGTYVNGVIERNKRLTSS